MSWYQEHKKASWIGVAAAVLLVLLGGGIFYFVHAHYEHKANAQKESKQKTGSSRVRIIHPKEGGVERVVRRPATVQAFEYADLYAKVSGYLRNQKVDIGSRVHEGDFLAEVSAPEKHADVNKAKADLEKANANLEAVEARVERAKADLLAAQALYKVSQARLAADKAYQKFREKQAKRYAGLFADRAIAEKLVDEQEDRLKAAIEAVHADEDAVAAAYAQVKADEAHVKQAKADVKDAKAGVGVAAAALERAVIWDEYTKIFSPYTGVITKRSFHNGDFIRAASEGGIRTTREEFPILAVARTDKMRVVLELPDQFVPYLIVGAPAHLEVDTLPDPHFKGMVARMAYREEYDTRTMRTEVDLENPDGLLKDGMFGWMTIDLGREKGVRIPSKCLVGQQKDSQRSVYVVRDSRACKVEVEIGIDDGIEVTIRKGLHQSDRVIVNRPSSLGDKVPVDVVQSGASEDVEKEEKTSHESPRLRMPQSANEKTGAKKQN